MNIEILRLCDSNPTPCVKGIKDRWMGTKYPFPMCYAGTFSSIKITFTEQKPLSLCISDLKTYGFK